MKTLFKYTVLGIIFWALTLLFTPITLTGMWTIFGVVVFYSIFNLIYQLTLSLLLIPLRLLTLDLIQLVVNVVMIYLLENIFTTFIIAPGAFWSVLLLSICYSFSKRLLFKN